MNLTTRLERAYEFFYPEHATTGFRPDAVDFFSLLKTYVEVGKGLSGGLRDSTALFDDLKFARHSGARTGNSNGFSRPATSWSP